ncbi:MAG: arginine--tRNA ligase [Bacteroidetes bacterium]|nr:arginine--tRNA ligase [Bacteroidota bacterium]
MYIVNLIQKLVKESLYELFGKEFSEKDFQINQVKQDFKGDYSVVLFALSKKLGISPADLGDKLAKKLKEKGNNYFEESEMVKGFLNLTISDNYWQEVLKNSQKENFGKSDSTGKKIMVEYSSPNTNKPLHLGHLRNIFLGWSISEILKFAGNEVFKSSITNDRGIHICKSMLAWQKFSNGETPETSNKKGDHLVGEYYVKFNDEYKKEINELMAAGATEQEAEKNSALMNEAREMLLKWENNDEEVKQLWQKMNSWVYEGFDKTYNEIGVSFDKKYYESNTYLLGKEIVKMGLEKGVFYKKDDGSVWIDLTPDGLDEKLVLRKDGTAVYITQDIGLALQKYEEYKIDSNIYVIGDEQNYHMKVLKLICEKLGIPNAENIFHLSYGMVELPSGKMKSREGTVVDADDIIKEMYSTAAMHTEQLGKISGFEPEELKELYQTLGLGAMKFYLLRVDPKKKMIFNPEESVDFHGFTGPFIQYTYARIKSILRKNENIKNLNLSGLPLLKEEKEILVLLEQYPHIVITAGAELNPSVVANYVYNLAKSFNSFYAALSVLNAESEGKKQLRLHISVMTANVIKSAMKLLGIRVPERM